MRSYRDDATIATGDGPPEAEPRPTALFRGPYVLRQLLATTNFSSVWLASPSWGSSRGFTTSASAGASLGAAAAGGSVTEPLAGYGTAAMCRKSAGAWADAATAPEEQLVVIKAVDASRPTHAAVAANEAAALRHLAATTTAATTTVAATAQATATIPRSTTEAPATMATTVRPAAGPTSTKSYPAAVPGAAQAPAGPRAGSGETAAPGISGPESPVEAAHRPPPPPPFVRLLDAFTTTTPAALTEMSLGLQVGVPGTAPERKGEHLTAREQASRPSGAGGRRWRCLVLERLGPSAADVMEAWQRRRQTQPQQQRPAAGAEAAAGRDSGRRQGWAEERRERERGGLPPGAVRTFAAQALAALDVIHRSARLVHCDVKPDNFALRHPPPWPYGHQGHPLTPPPSTRPGGHKAPDLLEEDGQPTGLHPAPSPSSFPAPSSSSTFSQPRSSTSSTVSPCPSSSSGASSHSSPSLPTWRWSLLDFGSACSLEPGGQRVADGPAGRGAKGHVRHCAAAAADHDDGESHVHGHGGTLLTDAPSEAPSAASYAWYDTPSYAAPELTLGLAPSPASDMWSLGCTVFELATGTKLLPLPPQAPSARRDWGAGGCSSDGGSAPDAAEVHLALVAQLLGRPPRGLLLRAPRAGWYFDLERRRLLLEDEYEVPPPCRLAVRLRQCAAAAAAGARMGRGAGSGLAAKVGMRLGAEGSGGEEQGVGPGVRGRGSGRSEVGAGAGEASVFVLTGGRMQRGCAGADWVLAREGAAAVADPAWAWRQYGWWDEQEGCEWDEREWGGLYGFLLPLLQWDPRDRPPAHVAARHPWLLVGRRQGGADTTATATAGGGC